MRGKNQVHSKLQKMQKLLEKEQQLEAELQRCQDNIDVFEEYYLQNSWRTGNIFLGWPICGYSEITEFINRPRAKKNTKPYVEIADHEKIFSMSSVSSRPFINVSKVSYLATKDLQLETRQKIPRSGLLNSKKSKALAEKLLKTEKETNHNAKNESRLKQEEDGSGSESESQSEDFERQVNSESNENGNSDSGLKNDCERYGPRNLKEEESEDEERESQIEVSSENEESSQSKERPSSKETSNRLNSSSKIRGVNKQVFPAKQVTFNYKNSKRTISLQSSD